MIFKEAIHVAVVDDHPLIREGIKSLLEDHEHLVVVAEGFAGEHVVPLVETYEPDVLILDLSMPQYVNSSGNERFDIVEATLALEALGSKTNILILSQHTHSSLINQAIERGVKGYLLKSDNLSLSLPEAIETVHTGNVYFSREISTVLFENPVEVRADLSERQIEIILAIAQYPDATYTQLAQQMGISESTFKGHLTKIFRLLGVTNATSAIISCMQMHLIPYSFDNRGKLEFGKSWNLFC